MKKATLISLFAVFAAFGTSAIAASSSNQTQLASRVSRVPDGGATVVLLGLGVVGLAAIRRRR